MNSARLLILAVFFLLACGNSDEPPVCGPETLCLCRDNDTSRCSPPDKTDAGAFLLACINTNADSLNCGACGAGCEVNSTCVDGRCTACVPFTQQEVCGDTYCGSAMLNDGCGGRVSCATNVCPAGEVCTNGGCQPGQ